MDGRADDSQWQDYQPELLCLGLRCPVCLDYFEKPHTLACGHSFCLRCLRTLAKMARSSTSRSPIDRLRFRCPSCRKMTIARPLLRRRASVTIALQDIVDAWFNSPYSVGKLEPITLRSISCQTNTYADQTSSQLAKTKKDLEHSNIKRGNDVPVIYENDNTEATDGEDDNEKIKDDISCEEIKHIIVHRFPPKSTKDKDRDILSNSTKTEEENPTDNNDTTSDVNAETSSSEEESDPEIVPLLGDIQVLEEPERRFAVSLRSLWIGIKLLFREIQALFRGIWNSRCRFLLTIFWLLYGGLIIGLSRGFLPWMVLYTLIYFLIMYAEISRPFLLRY